MSHNNLPFTAIASALPDTVPFVGPETLERRSGRAILARLGANESGFGPSPKVIEALQRSASDVWRYPDAESFALRTALAEKLKISPAEIAVGEGIDGLLGSAVRLFVAPGERVVTSLGAYPTLNYHVTGFGGTIVPVPYNGAHEDLHSLLAAVSRHDARVVYLANPDNPMGSFWPAKDIEAFAAALPGSCLLMLDEAYGEFLPEGALPSLDTRRDNVLRLRTFSKAYGLAGLRCGYAIGSRRVVGAFDRIRNHFGVNRQAQIAAAAALADTAHLNQVIEAVRQSCNQIANIASQAGLLPLPTATNFVAIDCGGDAVFAQAILGGLAEQGVFIRKPMAPGLDHCIRVSAAPQAEIEIFAEALPNAVLQAQGVA